MLRRWRSPVTRAAAAVGVALACAAPALPAYAATDPVRIWTDATGPLFESTNLRPGTARPQCLTLGYQGRDGTALRMAASTSGGLGSYLDLTVSVGSGGAYGRCSEFVGVEVYTGTLGDFSTRYADPSSGLALDDGAVGTGTVSIRVTLRLRDDNAAQGRTAESSFVWYALGAGADPAQPPDVEVPVTGGVPPTTPTPVTAAPTTPARPTTTAGPPSATPQPASPTPSASPELTLAPTYGGPPAATGGGGSRSLWEQVVDAASETVRAAGPAVVKGARIPLYLLPLVLVYLLIQNEIDRRDPKLALAPAYADPDLPFDYDPTPARA